MRRLLGMLAVLSVTLLAHAGAAYGASTSAAGDPPTGSPAGAVYELPFERGRAEAAPKGSGGTAAPGAEGGGDAGDSGTASGGGEAGGGSSGSDGSDAGAGAGAESGGEEGSLYRSENNFGSSSQVPGVTGDGEAAGAGSGSGSEAPSSLAEGREAAQASDSGNTSPLANLALLGAIALIALGSGLLVRRAGRLRTQA